jgi:hypothetical protein
MKLFTRFTCGPLITICTITIIIRTCISICACPTMLTRFRIAGCFLHLFKVHANKEGLLQTKSAIIWGFKNVFSNYSTKPRKNRQKTEKFKLIVIVFELKHLNLIINLRNSQLVPLKP